MSSFGQFITRTLTFFLLSLSLAAPAAVAEDLSDWLEEDISLEEYEEEEEKPSAVEKEWQDAGDKMHREVFKSNEYPSASECYECHERQYREWAVSPHAFSQVSPSNATQAIALLAYFGSTIGDFCARCHTPIGMELGEDPRLSNMDRAQVSAEGVTCISCHRVNKNYGVSSDARFFIHKGDINAPVYNSRGGAGFNKAANNSEFGLARNSEDMGRPVHSDVKQFKGLRDPKFCAQCHGVHLLNDMNVQKTPFEYKDSPAAKAGITCVDCHMGKTPGKPEGYAVGPVAVVGGKATSTREIINHHNAGPDFSILHPGIFPFNPKAQKLGSQRDWIQFNVEAGWGTDRFENNVPSGYKFPPVWDDVDLRYEAREIIRDNMNQLEWARKRRLELWRNGFKMDDVALKNASMDDGIEFEIRVWNGSDGHSVPSGFAMDRPVWLETQVIDPNGKQIFISGDMDPNGDLRDDLSLYVRAGELPLDKQLFNLNSKWIIPVKRGSHHNQTLPIGWSNNTIQFVRPEVQPANILGDPAAARFHRQGIEPGGERFAEYDIDDDLLTVAGTYTVKVRMRAMALPVYFLHSIAFAGYDYGMSARYVTDKFVEQSETIWQRELQIEVK